ncbi:hypothetical protein, partial [Nocardia farcinica]|uniref:hypothetical protein n=1 Tax=Nocardia farcinica TaxID=37329 RepID=UPI002457E3AE
TVNLTTFDRHPRHLRAATAIFQLRHARRPRPPPRGGGRPGAPPPPPSRPRSPGRLLVWVGTTNERGPR